MSGICGLKYADPGRPVEPGALERLAGSLDPDGIGGAGQVEFRGGGLGTHDWKAFSTARHADSSVAIAIQGALYEGGVQEAMRGGGEPLQNLTRDLLSDPAGFFRKLIGEFVVAAWDAETDTVYAAVDRFRIIPLFYTVDDDRLVFSSRIPGLVDPSLGTDASIDPAAIINIVGSSCIPTPRSIYRKVFKLPPGHYLKYSGGRLEVLQYWDFDFHRKSSKSLPALEEETRSLFSNAMASRWSLDSAGEPGAFLSGGVDSSTVVGTMAQIQDRQIGTFSIGFGEERFNEISYARIVAESFKSKHHEYFVEPPDVVSVIPKLLAHFDEPFANASAVPAFYCGKLAIDNGVDCLYAGDGGDELFAGNERYAIQRLFDYYTHTPRWIRGLVLQPALFLLGDLLRSSIGIKGKKYVRRASVPYPERLYTYDFFNTVAMDSLFTPDFLASVEEDFHSNAAVDAHYREARDRAPSELERHLYVDLKMTISDNDLFKVTRMTEAAGIAVRYPFLDTRLVEFANSIPARTLMKGRRLRSFFKDTYKEMLPESVLTKSKHGFGLPIPVWLKSDSTLNEMMHDLVLGRRAIERGYFRQETLQHIVEQHKVDETSFYGTILWNLMMLELWHRERVDA